MTIAIDIDEVLVDTAGWLQSYLKEEFGLQIDISAMNTFRIMDNAQIPKHMAEAGLSALHDFGMWQLVIQSEAIQSLHRLRTAAIVDIVTSRPLDTIARTERWLHESGATFRKLRRSSYHDKREYAGEYDILIDDNFAACNEHSIKSSLTFLIDAPPNRSAPYRDRIRRAPSLVDAIKQVMQTIELLGGISPMDARFNSVKRPWRRSRSYLGDMRGQLISSSDLILRRLLVEVLQMPPSQALDICCGIGVVSTELCELGWLVTAVDRSALKTSLTAANVGMFTSSGRSLTVITADADVLIDKIWTGFDLVHIDPDWGPPGHHSDSITFDGMSPSPAKIIDWSLRNSASCLVRLPNTFMADSLAMFEARAIWRCEDRVTGEAFIYALFSDCLQPSSIKACVDGISIVQIA